MPMLKQSTATTRMIFLTDSSDHISGKTGLTLTITASKAGAAFASITPTVTERGSGWYALALTTAHTDTLGDLALHVTASGADPTDKLYEVVAGSLDADVSSRLAPTTAGRTLDVSAGGEAGIDWANVGSPTTTVALSGTTVATVTTVGTATAVTNVTGDVQGKVIGGGSSTITGVSARVDVRQVNGATAIDLGGTAAAVASTTLTTDSANRPVVDITGWTITIQSATTGAFQSVKVTSYNTSTGVATHAGWPTTTPTGTIVYALDPPVSATVSLGSTAPAGWINSAAFASGATLPRVTLVDTTTAVTTLGNVTVGGYAAGQDPATLVLDTAASGHNSTNSIGSKINAAASAGDPWSTALPGSYASGTAGYIVGNRIDVVLSTRSTYAGGAVASVTAPVTVDTVTDKTGYSLAYTGLDSVIVESGVNARQSLAVIAAAVAGKSSGLDTSSAIFYAIGTAGTTTARIAATTSSGNRTATTLTLPT